MGYPPLGGPLCLLRTQNAVRQRGSGPKNRFGRATLLLRLLADPIQLDGRQLTQRALQARQAQ